MKLSASLLALSAAVAFALPQAFPPVPADTVYYYFRTSVKDGYSSAYDNLYLTAYHTGAGLSDATFVSGEPLESHRGWFNGTILNWFQPSPVNGGIFFGFIYTVGGSSYSTWSPVEINGGEGRPGVSLDSQNNLVPNSTLFGSWLVCDWWHNVPQLFTMINYPEGSEPLRLPSSCAEVNLVAEVAPPLASTTSSAVASATASY